MPQESSGVSIEMRQRIRSKDETGVMAWLSTHRFLFRDAETQFNIDRRAIAGAIAAEALYDIKPSWALMPRAVGLGKVHYREYWTSEGDPVAKQAEDLGLLPKVTMTRRRQILATDEGAVRYIAAIMDGFALVSNMPQIRCNLGALGTLYSAWDYRDVQSGRWVLPVKRTEFNAMGAWFRKHQQEITRSVGVSKLQCEDQVAKLLPSQEERRKRRRERVREPFLREPRTGAATTTQI